MSEQLPHAYYQAVRNAGIAVIGGWLALNAANYAQAAIERPTDDQVAALQAEVDMPRTGTSLEVNTAIDQAADAHEDALRQQARHDDIERWLQVGGGLAVAGAIGDTVYVFYRRRQDHAEPIPVEQA